MQAVAWGMLLALSLGLILAIARRSSVRFISWPVALFVEFIRSTPLLVQLFFLYYGLLPALGWELAPFLTGVIGLGIHYSTYTSEVYRSGIEGVPRGQWEAAQALNLSRWQTYRHVVLPQAIPPIIPALGNYLIAMFKGTPLLMAITVLEILRQADLLGKEHFRFVEPITMVGVIYLLLSLVSSQFVRFLESRMTVRQGATG